jgi:protein-L-isoaspartate(D-aspartate) O-methyltransferase
VTQQQLAGMRTRLVAHLKARGDVRTERVAAAFERVPRHLFVPDLAPEDVYTDRSIAIKLQDGVPISSSSQPAIMAEMLEMLALAEGDQVLEIGAGSGYNAALLAELVGPSGAVETIDLDDDLVKAARSHLDAAGYPHVRAICADGARGDPHGAAFDAVIATVGVERIPPAWIAQLRDGGRLVAPLTIRSMQRVVAFERTAVGLESRAIVDAGFMMLRGPSASEETRTIALGDPAIVLRVLTAHAGAVDGGILAYALRAPAHDAVPVRRIGLEDAWNGLSLWLALTDDASCRLTASGPRVADGTVPNLLPGSESLYGTSATFGIVSGHELVVFARRGSYELVLRSFGTPAGGLARLQNAIAEWDRAGRPGNAQLRITVAPDGTTLTYFAMSS